MPTFVKEADGTYNAIAGVLIILFYFCTIAAHILCGMKNWS